MAKIPTYDSQQGLNPTPMDPQLASTEGRNISDLGKMSSKLGETLQELQNKTETLKAETFLTQKQRESYHTALSDPDIFNLESKIQETSTKNIDEASSMIKSPQARNEFTSKAALDTERRNIPVYNLIYRRQSQDFKGSVLKANDEDIKDYQLLKDPNERQLLRDRISQRTEAAVKSGFINAQWGKHYIDTTLKTVDLQQVKSDMSVDAEGTYHELQKGKEGLYPEISQGARKQFIDQAQKQIAKQGIEKNMIFGIAQNHAENTLVDKMGKGVLTQDDINNASLIGVNGVKVRPEFAKAATEALMDPFPTQSNSDKYNNLVAKVMDPDSDPVQTKIDVLSARGLTPQQKSHLISSALREDPIEGKASLDNLIRSGSDNNKNQILEANMALKKEQADRKTFFRGITDRFRDHAKDEKHLADLQQDYFSKVQQAKSNEDRIQIANQIMNNDTLIRNPKVATADKNGSVFMDKVSGGKRIYYPDGHWEPVKNGR